MTGVQTCALPIYELEVPAGLNQRIVNLTSGLGVPETSVEKSLAARAGEWLSGLRLPGIPQLAPVAMMLTFAFLVFSQTVSADGSLAGVYQTSVALAEITYQQGADAWNGKSALTEQAPVQEPIAGTTVNNGDQK